MKNTLTTDIGAVIPPTVLNKIVQKMESVGMVLPLVTNTNFKSGLAIPTSNVMPVATWVAEGTGLIVKKQQLATSNLVTSNYNAEYLFLQKHL